MKRLALVILTALTLGITGSASAQFGRNYWYLDADTLKVINPNWFIAAQNFVPIIGGTTNLFLGYQSGDSITTGAYNLGLGFQSMYYAGAGSYNIGLGYQALSGNYPMPNTSTYNIALGYEALWNLSDGDEEIGIGFHALLNDTSSNLNVMVGTNAGLGIYNSFSAENIGIGNNVLIGGTGFQPGSQNVAIGNAAAQNITGSGSVIIGANAATYPENLDSSVVIGFNSNWGDRYGAGGERNSVAIGLNAAGYGEGFKNVYIGEYSGYNASGNFNSGDIPFNNAFLGAFSGFSDSTGWNNTYIGAYSGYSNGSGIENTFLGNFAGYANRTGSGNVFLGDSSGYNETGSDKLYISNSSTSSPLVYGDFAGDSLRVNGQLSSSGNITGYGNATLSEKLTVNGTSYLETTHTGDLFVNGATGNMPLNVQENNQYGTGINIVNTNTTSANWLVQVEGSSNPQPSAFAIYNQGAGTTGYALQIDQSLNATLAGNLTVNGTGTSTFAGLIKTGGYVSSASDQSFTNSTTQTNITGLSVPLQANTTYSFTAQLFTSVAASAGEATSVYYGGNTPTYVIYGIVAEDNSVIDVSNWTNTIGTPFSDNTGSAVTPMIKVQGTITTGSTAANLTIRYAQSTAQATANVVKQGSWLHVWQTN